MTDQEESKIKPILNLLVLPIIASMAILSLVAGFFLIRSQVITSPLADFDQMVVTDGFHHITLPSGQYFDLSYEQNHDRIFDGVVRHTSMNHENDFPIISFDILVTSGDFANEDLVSTNVENHHFTWRSRSGTSPQGTINLLHTLPMNQAIQEQLKSVKVGDHIIVKGWDILKIKGYSANGDYIGYWQDAGCNTTLVTDMFINP